MRAARFYRAEGSRENGYFPALRSGILPNFRGEIRRSGTGIRRRGSAEYVLQPFQANEDQRKQT
jgi:hypothetical protein